MWLLIAVLWASLWCGTVSAQLTAAGDSIRLALADCEDVPGARVRELVVLEVAPRTVLAADSTEGAATRAQMTCEAGIASIVVEDLGGSTPVRLEVTLSDFGPPARPRALALAVAELIATSRLQRPQPAAAEQAPAHSARHEARAQPYDPPDASAPTRSGTQLWLGVGAAHMAQPSMLGPSGALGVVAYWGTLAVTSDLRFEHAERTQSLAELQLDAGSVALAPAWRLHMPSADLLIGAGVRAGFAQLRGSSRDPNLDGESLTGFWLAPCAQAALQVRLVRRWALRISLEAAYITRKLRGLGADGSTLLELRDLTLAAQLGLSWQLSAFD